MSAFSCAKPSLALRLEGSYLKESRNIVDHPLRLLLEKNVRGSEEKLRNFVAKASQILTSELCKRRIYCLTLLADSILMWSHYARNHTGVCLEFRVDDSLFGHALKVDYLENYPSFTPQDANIDPTSMILAKAKDWAY